MAKCKSITKKVFDAGATLATSKSKSKLSKAGTILKKHQDQKH